MHRRRGIAGDPPQRVRGLRLRPVVSLVEHLPEPSFRSRGQRAEVCQVAGQHMPAPRLREPGSEQRQRLGRVAGHPPLAKAPTARGVSADLVIIETAQQLMGLVDQTGTAEGKYRVDLQGAQGVQVGDGNQQFNTFNSVTPAWAVGPSLL